MTRGQPFKKTQRFSAVGAGEMGQEPAQPVCHLAQEHLSTIGCPRDGFHPEELGEGEGSQPRFGQGDVGEK